MGQDFCGKSQGLILLVNCLDKMFRSGESYTLLHMSLVASALLSHLCTFGNLTTCVNFNLFLNFLE